jgi:hypothetical protein
MQQPGDWLTMRSAVPGLGLKTYRLQKPEKSNNLKSVIQI